MQFQVPQNIDLEDKIIGPLTLIQFLYLIAGGVVDYMLYITFGKYSIIWILIIPIAIVALSFAFLKIQDQPLSHFIKAGFVYISRPRIRIWHRHGFQIEIVKVDPHKKKEAPKPPPKKQIEKSELEKLAQTLDTQKVQQSKIV